MNKFQKKFIESEILSPKSLFSKKDYLSQIKYWSKVLNRPNGWHYDLDIIWILNKLKQFNVAYLYKYPQLHIMITLFEDI